MRGLGGWAKHIPICLRPSADPIVLRLGSPFDYGARGFIGLASPCLCCPLWSFQKATQTKNFLSILFPLRGGGVGGGDARKRQGSFWVCPRESASAAGALSSAIGAYEKLSSHHALSRVRSVALRLEIGSSGAVYFHTSIVRKERPKGPLS